MMNVTARDVVKVYLSGTSSGQGSEQLEMGRKVEQEHKDVFDLVEKAFGDAGVDMPFGSDEFYEMIAKAHLSELPDYYTRLKKMESENEKEAMDFSSIDTLLKPTEPMDQRETARAIRQAICAEHDAVHLYELIADSCSNKAVKELLQDIADEEKVHIGELQQLLSILDIKDEEFLEEGRVEAEKILD